MASLPFKMGDFGLDFSHLEPRLARSLAVAVGLAKLLEAAQRACEPGPPRISRARTPFGLAAPCLEAASVTFLISRSEGG